MVHISRPIDYVAVSFGPQCGLAELPLTKHLVSYMFKYLHVTFCS